MVGDQARHNGGERLSMGIASINPMPTKKVRRSLFAELSLIPRSAASIPAAPTTRPPAKARKRTLNRAPSREHQRLLPLLHLHFGRSFAELSPDRQDAVTRHYSLVPWEILTPHQRMEHAAHIDAQHPRDSAEAQAIRADFNRGFKRISVPRRNKANAKRPRHSRQVVTDIDILLVKGVLEVEGVAHRNQCSEARRRLLAEGAIPISPQGFRKRWNRLGLNRRLGR